MKKSILEWSQNNGTEEIFENLLQRPGIRVERILSTGQSSPKGFWYDQEEEEWVMVISGEATLEFKSPPEMITLSAGDYLLIPAHKKHRVVKTTNPTIWLTLWIHQPNISAKDAYKDHPKLD